MRQSIGKQVFLTEVFNASGQSLIAIMSNPTTVYQRKDGSHFVMIDGRRLSLQVQTDGSFYLRVDPKPYDPRDDE